MAKNSPITIKSLNATELKTELDKDPRSFGCGIGISDKCWKFAIYLGDNHMLVMFEKSSGVHRDSFVCLRSAASLSSSDNRALIMRILRNNVHLSAQLISLEDLGMEFESFFKYEFNIFATGVGEKMKPVDLLDVLQHNLEQMQALKPGDVVVFHRSVYTHHAILADCSNMTVVHRYGEPEDAAPTPTVLKSVFGLPTEKGTVTLSHLIEVAAHRKIGLGNELYDRKYKARRTDEIVEVAVGRLGEAGYSVTRMNCHHFVSECRNGNAYSPEVTDAAMYTAIGWFGAALGLGLINVLSKFWSRRRSTCNAATDEKQADKDISSPDVKKS